MQLRRLQALTAAAIGVLAVSAELVAPSGAAAGVAAEAQDPQGAKPVVYLTFDDGPGVDTPRFLDLLDSHNIDATFFVTGKAVATNPETAVRIVAEGHAIANHTWNHPRLTALSSAEIYSEFDRTNDIIESTTGVVPSCYRPPYGSTNARVHDRAVAAGLPNAEWTTGSRNSHWGLWDVDTNDWRLSLAGGGWTEAAMRRELDKAGDGDTVLMHDGFARRPRGLAVLSQWLADNGDRFEFRTLPGCGGEIVEPAIDDGNPERWHRFQIARLYRAYFDREPDAEGWEFWNREFATGSTLADISYSFAQSSEFSQAGLLSDAEFVEFVYGEVLHRESDPEGFAYWLQEIDDGLGRGELVIYFSESEEYIQRTAEVITGNCYAGEIGPAYRCFAAELPVYDWS